MKRQISKNLLWTVVPAVLWLCATYARPWVIGTRCSTSPETCTKESVLSMDQLSLGMEDPMADEYSYQTQNLSGVWALVVPATWSAVQMLNGSLSPVGALTMAGKDLLTLLQVASWNGLFTETSHLISQRPRPFVYSDPAQRGTDPAHYTSFYSGHTSFAAAMTTAVFFILLNRGAPLLLLLVSFVSSEALVLSTAYFRILAGRHFLTDVVSGAIAGCLIAYRIVGYKKTKWR